MTMICDSLAMLNRVAKAGAVKCIKQGYSYSKVITGKECLPGEYDVDLPNAKPEDRGYRVNTRLKVCHCAFWTNNRPHFKAGETTCKHIEFVKIEEAIIAQGEEDAENRAWEGQGDIRHTYTGSRSLAEVTALVAAELPDEDEDDHENGDQWDNIRD